MSHELQAYARNLADDLDRLLDMNILLRQDIQRLLDAFGDDWNDPCFRRTIIRSCWAYIEAVTYGVKRFTLRASDLGSVDLPKDEWDFLSEQSLTSNADGIVRVQPKFSETKENIKKTFNIAGQRFNLEWRPNFGDGNWDDLVVSIGIRHRVTHPKSVADLEISDNEIEQHRTAFLWFSSMFMEFLDVLRAKHGQ